MEDIRVNGFDIELDAKGGVRFQGLELGRVAREERFGQWFWRAYSVGSDVPLKRFFTARHEAIRLLLIQADLMDGLGY